MELKMLDVIGYNNQKVPQHAGSPAKSNGAFENHPACPPAVHRERKSLSD
jgi:hypothetical protein